MSVTTKKIQLLPFTDSKEERERIYNYLRDGIYNQHHILNTYMSQMGVVYYKYNKDIKNPDYKEEVKAIFRNTNIAIKDFTQAKGLAMAANCGMQVKSDFSIAIRNGLAKGERSLPFYKRDFPLLVPSRFLNFYSTTESYKDDFGEIKTRDIYAIKFVNGIHFKVVLGSRGRNDFYINSLLDSILNDPDNYHVCGSSIQFSKGGKIILNLTVKISKQAEEYEPVKGRVMGLAMGYDKCLVAAISDKDDAYSIGDYIQESIVEERIKIQEYTQRLQRSMKSAQGGRGRKRKMRSFDKKGSHEKNVVRHFNHILSKNVVEFAKKHKVETIVIEDVNEKELKDHPTLLRNWSFYQLITFISYKAKAYGISVEKSSSKDKPRMQCCFCGEALDKEDIIPKEIEWQNELYFTCPKCGKRIEYSFNKAKNMTVMG